MLILTFGLGTVAIMFMATRYWVESNTRDMGTMSRQWLAEYNAQHP